MRCSPLYRSVAVGPPQPDYLNAVAELDTTLEAELLLNLLQDIEKAHGRVRTLRWGARTLDLDLLLFGDLEIATDRLTVPHPAIKERNFVLQPLYDLQPELLFPDGTSVRECLQATGDAGLKKLDNTPTQRTSP